MNIDSLIGAVQSKGVDQSQVKKGAELPAAGTARARLVGYFELGKHAGEYKGQPKTNNKVQLVFELSGKNHAPRQSDNGPIPQRLSVNLNLSQSENSQYFKAFARMRGPDTKHMVQLLGERAAFLVDIVHVKKDDRTYANIDMEKIRPAYLEQLDEAGEVVKTPIPVDSPLTEVKAFVWDFATPESWDAIYIPGEYEERRDDNGKVTAPARSKNVIQERIRAAINFDSLPCHAYALGAVSAEAEKALEQAVGSVAGVGDEDEYDPMAGIG